MSRRRFAIQSALAAGVLAFIAGFGFEREAQAHPAPAMRFEPNVGQFAAKARFAARGMGYALFLDAEGATLSLSRRVRAPAESHRHALPDPSELEQAVVTMRVVGARSVEPVAGDPLAGASNYFMGEDSSAWRTGVVSYASARYEDVLPGVTLVYYGGADRELEYDFLLEPGADPQGINLAFEGVKSIRIATDGSAILRLAGGGELRKAAPIAFQSGADGARIPVVSRYVLRGNKLGFTLGKYDHSRPLRIDPVLLYSSYVGGSSFDQAYASATDSAGNTYLVGYTSSTLFPTFDPLQPTLAGGVYDAFICKLSASGAFVYSTFLGGKDTDLAYAIATDSAGNAYVAGVTFSTDFPTRAPLQASNGGSQDGFIAKLNSAGSGLVYSTYLGGAQDDYAQGIAVDVLGQAFVAGTTFSNNFPKVGALQAARNGTSDAFVSKVAASGGSLLYSTYLGGSDLESANAIAIDSSGSAFVVGSTGSANFPLTTPLQATFGGGGSDAFVSKLNAAGSALSYSTFLGGTANDEAAGVAVQSTGLATVVGDTFSSNFPIGNAAQPHLGSVGHSDAFVTRLSVAGNALAFSTFLGGSGDDSAAAVGVDSNNSAYVVGSTSSSDFPQARSLTGQSTYHGNTDGFATALDPSGAPFYYSTYLGGSAEDHAVSVSVQPSGVTHIVGNTYSNNFPVLNGAISNIVGSQDGFLTRLPGIPVGVPASGRWNLLVLGAALLGLTLLGAATARKRVA